MLNMKQTSADIHKLQMEFADAFHQAADASRVEAIQALKPGAPAPAAGKIYGDSNRAAFEGQAAGLRGHAYSILDAAKKELSAEMSAAPNTDAVNAVAMLRLRDHLTGEEIQSALDAYGNNYMCYQAIRDAARAHDIDVDPHPLEQAGARLASMANTVGTWTATGAESMGAADKVMIEFAQSFGG